MFRQSLLILKSQFKNLSTNFYKFLFFALVMLQLIFIFTPIAKVTYKRFLAENRFINQSGRFDYRLTLPNALNWKLLVNDKSNFNENFSKQMKKIWKTTHEFEFKKWDFLSVSKAVSIDISLGIFLRVETFDNNSITFNKIVFSKNSNLNFSNPNPTSLKDDEIIVNEIFLLNNPKIAAAGKMKIFGKELKIVAAGSRINNYSFGGEDISNIILNPKYQKNPYHSGAFVYVSNDLFQKFKDEKKILNHKNFLYIKAKKNLTKPANPYKLKTAIEAYLERTIELTSFSTSLESGLKIFLNKINLYILIGVFIIIFLMVLFIFFLFLESELKTNMKYYLSILSNGFSIEKISFFQATKIFIILSTLNLIGYFSGIFFLYDFFLNELYNSVNISLSKNKFELNEIFFISFVIPLFFSLFVYWYANFFLNKYFQKWKKISIQKKIIWGDKFFLILGINWIILQLIKIKKNFLSFRAFQKSFKQVSLICCEVFLIILIFVAILIKFSFDNYILGGAKFLKPKVISSTQFSNTLFLDHTKKMIKSKIKFKSTNITKEYEAITSQDELKKKIAMATISTLSNNDGSVTYNDLNFKITKNIDSPKIKEYLDLLNFNEIYFGIAPYDESDDLLGIILNIQFQNNKKELLSSNVKQNNQQLAETAKILFFNDLADGKLTNEFLSIRDHLISEVPKLNYIKKANHIYVTEQFLTNYGYKLGEEIRINIKLNNEILKNDDKFFRIVGVISSDVFATPLVFADYDYLKNNKIISSDDPFYNLILTRNQKPHISRFLVIDWVTTQKKIKTTGFNFDVESDGVDAVLEYLSIVNLKSIRITEINQVFKIHFSSYQRVYLFIIYVLILLFFMSIVLITLFFFITNVKTFDTLTILGHRKKELISIIFFWNVLKKFYILAISSAVNFGIYWLLNQIVYQSAGVQLRLDGFEYFLPYFVFIYFIFFAFIIIAQLSLLKNKKNSKNFFLTFFSLPFFLKAKE